MKVNTFQPYFLRGGAGSITRFLWHIEILVEFRGHGDTRGRQRLWLTPGMEKAGRRVCRCYSNAIFYHTRPTWLLYVIEKGCRHWVDWTDSNGRGTLSVFRPGVLRFVHWLFGSLLLYPFGGAQVLSMRTCGIYCRSQEKQISFCFLLRTFKI